jgi:hypothetical protein
MERLHSVVGGYTMHESSTINRQHPPIIDRTWRNDYGV